MTRLFPSNKSYSVPLLIGDGDSKTGSRLGGLPPVGVIPRQMTPSTRYFCTLRIAEDPVLEVSVFLSFDFDSMWEGAGLLQASGELFEVITHGESVRGEASDLVSELTSHPLLHGKICEDHLLDEDGTHIVSSHHKLGGAPYIQNTGDGLPEVVRQMYEEDYFQVVQIDFPGADDDAVDGDWPFADGIFHLFGKEPLEHCSWKSFWEY